MTELSFAKSFLSSLDSKPARLPADYVEDPRNYPATSLPYILPHMSRPMSKPSSAGAPPSLAPGQERSLTVTVTSLRNPPLEVRLTGQPADASVLDIKTVVAQRAGGIPLDKVRLLHRKKPVPDSKVLRELLVPGDDDTGVELTVMVLGGAATLAAAASNKAASTADGGGSSVGREEVGLDTDEFWSDLKGFLLQRVRDEKKAAEAYDTFRTAWSARR